MAAPAAPGSVRGRRRPTLETSLPAAICTCGAASAVYLELDAGDVLADLREDLAAQPVMFLVRVVDPVGVGVPPVIGNRKAPSAVAQPEIESDAHRHQSRKPERGDTREALAKQRGIGRLLSGIFGWPQTPDYDVADHQRFPGRIDIRTSIAIRASLSQTGITPQHPEAAAVEFRRPAHRAEGMTQSDPAGQSEPPGQVRWRLERADFLCLGALLSPAGG